MRNTLIKVLYNRTKDNSNIILITGDLGYNVINEFRDSYPNNYINAGIAEQNMTLLAIGLAIENYIVFTYSIGNFNSLRVLEQIRNGMCYHNLNVNIVSIGAGFAYGALGFTHHLTEDIAVMKSMPNLIVFSPCDIFETNRITNLSIDYKGPCYIRLGKGKEPEIHKEVLDFNIGEAVKIYDGNNIVIFSTGSITYEAKKAVEYLSDKYSLDVGLYSFPTIKPIDEETIINCSNKYNFILTLEENNIIGGFGTSIATVIAENGCSVGLKILGIPDVLASVVGDQDYLRKYYGIDYKSIIKVISNIINETGLPTLGLATLF